MVLLLKQNILLLSDVIWALIILISGKHCKIFGEQSQIFLAILRVHKQQFSLFCLCDGANYIDPYSSVCSVWPRYCEEIFYVVLSLDVCPKITKGGDFFYNKGICIFLLSAYISGVNQAAALVETQYCTTYMQIVLKDPLYVFLNWKHFWNNSHT